MDQTSLTEQLEEILAICDETDEPLTTPEVADHLDLGRRTAYNRLERLVEYNHLKTKKVGASARIWWRPKRPIEQGDDENSQVGQSEQVTRVEQQFRSLIEATDEYAILLIDPEGYVQTWNPGAARIKGYDADDILDKHFSKFYTTEDRTSGIPERNLRAAAHEGSIQDEGWRLRDDGSRFWANVTITAIRSDDGELIGYAKVTRDITERKERERELQQKERRFRTLIENFPNGAVALVNDDLRYTTFGGTPEGGTELTREDFEGNYLRDVLPRKIADLVIPRHEEALKGNPSRFVETVDDRVYQFHFLPVHDGDGEIFQAMGMSQDITEREEREQELRNRIRQQKVVSDLGTRALEERELDALMAEAARLVAETLDTDYCKVLDLDAESEELLLRHGVGWDEDIVGEATVSAVEDGSQAAYTLATEEPVLVDDLTTESRFSGPALLRNHDVRSGISTIIGPADEPWGIFGTHDSDYREFSGQDATFVQAVANILATAIDRHQHEQELVHQREQLAALNSLNEVIRDITSAVIEQSTRTEIEETVCERLAGTDSYLFAWTGDVDPNAQTVNMRTEAGVNGYLDDVTISVDPTDERSDGPTGRALRTGNIQVTEDVRDDPRYDPWRRSAEEYGFRSSAAVPIVYDDTIYGVLNIYSSRPNAFTGQERTMLTQLGEVVGHAIAAAERKQALMSNELVELEFQIRDIFSVFDGPVRTDETIRFEHTLAVGNGQFLVYGSAMPDAMESIRGLVESVPFWESVTVRSEGDTTHFELHVTDSPVLSAVASHGGYVDSAVIEDGDFRMTIHLAPTVDVRQVIDTVKDAYPRAEMVRRQQVTRVDDELHPFNRQLVADLTDRQRSALEAAYYAGHFEWPRNTSGEEVAESLGVAPPTFHQHLRKAEQKVFETIFSASV